MNRRIQRLKSFAIDLIGFAIAMTLIVGTFILLSVL